MELEEAIKILKDTIVSLNNPVPFKYTNYKKSQAIETVLNHVSKQDKMIELMVNALYDEKYEELICMEVDCEHIEIRNEGKCIGKDCIREYFEKKANEE